MMKGDGAVNDRREEGKKRWSYTGRKEGNKEKIGNIVNKDEITTPDCLTLHYQPQTLHIERSKNQKIHIHAGRDGRLGGDIYAGCVRCMWKVVLLEWIGLCNYVALYRLYTSSRLPQQIFAYE